MKILTPITLIALLTISTAVQAQKAKVVDPVPKPDTQWSTKQPGTAPNAAKKSKSLQQDWLNGILRGKDMSNLSQSYVSQSLKSG